MTKKQKDLAIEAKEWCDDNDKSTEYTLQFIADSAQIEYDEAVDFLIDQNAV